jgi:hypothetical protein
MPQRSLRCSAPGDRGRGAVRRPRVQWPRAWRSPVAVLPLLLLLASCSLVGGDEGAPAATPERPPDTRPPAQVDPLFRPPVWEDTKFGLHMDLTFDSDPASRRQAIQEATSLGVEISRNSFLWDRIQPTEQAAVDWSLPDALVSELASSGIEPMFVAYGSPTWANGVAEGTEDARMYVPEDDAAFDEWVSRYAHLMRVAAERYRGQVIKWEVWNEQNEDFFWKPAPNVDRYVQFFQAVREAILQGNPEAQVAMGGLAGLAATGDGNIRGADFLQQMLDRGVRPDYVNIHPYPSEEQGPDDHNARQNNFDDIQLIHDVLVEAGHEVPIWVTEWGWRSDEVGADTQAQYVARSLEKIATEYPFVTVATYFIDYDRPEFTQGLFDANRNPKPAAEAFRAFMMNRAK